MRCAKRHPRGYNARSRRDQRSPTPDENPATKFAARAAMLLCHLSSAFASEVGRPFTLLFLNYGSIQRSVVASVYLTSANMLIPIACYLYQNHRTTLRA